MLLKMMILSLWHWWPFNDLNVWILSVVFIDMILRSQCFNIYWCAQRFNDKISRDVHIAARKFVAVGETIEKKTAISKLVEATRAPISLKLSISNNHLDVQFAFKKKVTIHHNFVSERVCVCLSLSVGCEQRMVVFSRVDTFVH